MDIALWILVALVAVAFPFAVVLFITLIGWMFFSAWFLRSQNGTGTPVQIQCAGEVTEIHNPQVEQQPSPDDDEPWKNRFPEDD